MNKNAHLTRVAASLRVGSPERVAVLSQVKEAGARLYFELLDYLNTIPIREQPYLRLDRNLAEGVKDKDFEILAKMFFSVSTRNPSAVHAWASRIRDPNTAIRMSIAGWRLSEGRISKYDNSYFFNNWKYFKDDFKLFGALIDKACEDRLWEIVGRSSRVKPEAPVKSEAPAFTPPDIPSNLVPTTAMDWDLYSSQSGANGAAKAIASAMTTALKMLGRNVTPQKSDTKNAEAVRALRKRMNKVLETYVNWGALDGEPESVVRSVMARYLKLYLDKFDFPKTYDALSRF